MYGALLQIAFASCLTPQLIQSCFAPSSSRLVSGEPRAALSSLTAATATPMVLSRSLSTLSEAVDLTGNAASTSAAITQLHRGASTSVSTASSASDLSATDVKERLETLRRGLRGRDPSKAAIEGILGRVTRDSTVIATVIDGIWDWTQSESGRPPPVTGGDRDTAQLQAGPVPLVPEELQQGAVEYLTSLLP
jgi:hypothetical protein